jgi:PTS system cellobiose-specific IIB component
MADKKIKVVLVCAAGMSSSLLEEKIRKAAEKAGRDMELKAIDSSSMGMWDFEKNAWISSWLPPGALHQAQLAQRVEPWV